MTIKITAKKQFKTFQLLINRIEIRHNKIIKASVSMNKTIKNNNKSLALKSHYRSNKTDAPLRTIVKLRLTDLKAAITRYRFSLN